MIAKKIKQLWYKWKYRSLYKAIKEETILYPELMKYKGEFINSMEVLIEHYKDAIAIGVSKKWLENIRNLDCLLCNPIECSTNRQNEHNKLDIENFSILNQFKIFNESCKNLGCPWIVITGFTCANWSHKYMDSAIYFIDNPILQEARIKQLENWIKLYKEYKE